MEVKSEQKNLTLSVAANLFLAAIALYYGYKTKSEAIKLDGYYSFASFILALISLWIVKMVVKPETENYNFGYSLLEPLFNLVKGIMILAVVISSATNAINSLLHGGNTPSFNESIVYFIVSTVMCFLMTLLFYRQLKKKKSPIIHVEYKNWFIDTMISASIGVVFVTSYFLQNTKLDSLVHYTDPVITLGVILFIIKLPLFTIKTSVKEILLSVPEDKTVEKIDRIISEILSGYDIVDYNFKVTKTGRELYLLCHIQVVNPNDLLYHIKTQDNVRAKIENALSNLSDIVKVDIVFSESQLKYSF